jgi:3-oxoacyl-[acyl-carrier protein] reductase
MELTGRVALITGGARMGVALARRLASAGADVACTYRASVADAEAAVSSARTIGRRGIAVRADLGAPDDCARVVAETVAHLGRLDVLISMASRYVKRSFDELEVDDWNAQLEIDLRASFLCAKAAVPHMRRVGGGRIVNVSDWVAASRRPRYAGYLPYYVAKTGVIALTEALALELAADHILVNAVAPGPIVPPAELSDEERRAVEEATPLGRWGGAEEVAKAVLALVETDFITGETVRVDGGRHLR